MEDTWFDLCLVDALDDFTEFRKTDTFFITGHDLIIATIKVRTPKLSASSYTYRDDNQLTSMYSMTFSRNVTGL